MSARVIVTLCVAIFVAGCASPRPAPRDPANDARTEQQIQATREKTRRLFLLMAQAAANAKIKELGPRLILTPEQADAFRQAYTNQFAKVADDIAKTVSQPLGIGNRKPANAREPHHLQSDRALLQPLLAPRQMAAYDAFSTKQRNERAANLAAARLDRIDSPLGLNDEQRNQIREIFVTSEKQRLKATEDYDLAAQPDFNRETQTLRGILTRAQFKRYKKLCKSEQPKYQAAAQAGFSLPPTVPNPPKMH